MTCTSHTIDAIVILVLDWSYLDLGLGPSCRKRSKCSFRKSRFELSI